MPGRDPLRRHRVAAPGPARGAAATLLLLLLVLQCFDVRAEIVFRSVQRQDGQRQWSAPRRYANPAEVVYPRMLADGTRVSAEEVQVFVQGYITPDDVYAVKVMESLVKRGSQVISGNSVSLAGSGGDVDAAMEVGRVLRRLRVTTTVDRGNQCVSSCVFAFMGGDRRVAVGRVGIHRPYFASNRKVPDRRAYYRQLQKRLQDYVEELDFPPSLYEAIMAIPPERISILTAQDLKRFYLQGMSPAAEDEADAESARNLGISVSEYLQKKARADQCDSVTDATGACEGATQNAAASGAEIAAPRPLQAYAGGLPAVGSVAGQNDFKAQAAGAGPGSDGAEPTIP